MAAKIGRVMVSLPAVKKKMLEEMAKEDMRTRSNFVAWLIREEAQRRQDTWPKKAN